MHMGSTLKLKWMLDWRDCIHGGYIMPPIGGFYTHLSTTTTGRILDTHLKDKWAQPGTRTRPDHPEDKVRRVCLVTEKGHANYVTEGLNLPELHDEAAWKTEAPPGTPREALGVRPRHLGVAHAKDTIGNVAEAVAAPEDKKILRHRQRKGPWPPLAS